MIVFLGTRRAFGDLAVHEDGTAKTIDERLIHATKARVEISFPPDIKLGEALTTVTAPGGVWSVQSPDASPAWVSSDVESLAELIGQHYGIDVREFTPAGERGEFAGRFEGQAQ